MKTLLRSTLLGAFGAATVVGALPASAHAADLVYYQDFEEANAFTAERWLSTGTCATWARSPNAPPPGIQSKEHQAPECSGRYATETIPWSGGRVMSRTPIPVAANDRMCVTGWIRANGAGANRARPFVGVNFISSANPNGFGDAQGSVGGCHNGEHWLIGNGFDDSANRSNTCNAVGGAYADEQCCGRALTGYGAVSEIAGNGDWNFYSKTFTVTASDVTVAAGVNAGTYNRMVLKFQNWSGGGPLSCPANPQQDAVPGADFDDLRVYKLAAGEECPTAAQIVGDDSHVSCNAAQPFCKQQQVQVQFAGGGAPVPYNQNFCGGCEGSFGDAGQAVCAAATPVCANGACGTCSGDAGTVVGAGNTHVCGGQQPYCKANGECGQCVDNADCVAAGKTHAGTLCVAGACTNACTIEADGGSLQCGDNRFCVTGDNPGCRNKLPNGTLLPERDADGANKGECRLAGEGAPETATLFCASGVCNKVDKMCGLADGDACTAATGAAQCRAGVCGGDDKCGLQQYEPCNDDLQCRGALTCDGGYCGGQRPQCVVDTDCGAHSFACDPSGACVPGCHNNRADACAPGKVCDAVGNDIGTCIDDPNPNTSSSGGSSSGGSSSGDNTSSGGSSSGDNTSSGGSSSGDNTSGGNTSSSGDNTSGGNTSSGNNGGDDDDRYGDVELTGGCSTSGDNAASLTPMLLGVGVALGAMRRRKRA